MIDNKVIKLVVQNEFGYYQHYIRPTTFYNRRKQEKNSSKLSFETY